MDPQLQNLLAAGAADAQRMLGTQATLYHGQAEYWSGSLVWVETGGSYSVELGGALYSVTGRATLRAAAVQEAPKPGDRLKVNGQLHLIVGCFRSPFDATFNLEATLLPR